MNKYMKSTMVLFLMFVGYNLCSEVLNYEQVMAEAKAKNWDLQLVKAKYIQANAMVYKTLSAYLPRLSITGNYTNNSHESKISMPLSNGQIKDIVIQPTDQFGLQAQVTQMLISPWQIFQLANTDKYKQSIFLSGEQARRDILFGVAQLYYGVAASKQAVEVQKRLLEGRKAREKDVKLRFEQGYVIKAEVLRAEIETSKNEQDLNLAENAYQSSKLALASMLGREADFDFEITDPPLPRRPSEEQISLLRLNNRLDLKSAKFQQDLANSIKNFGFLRFLPDLSMFALYKASDTASLGGEKNTLAAGFNLTWNVFDGGMREAEFYENSGKALEARAKYQLQDLKVRQEIEQAKLDLKSAEANAVKALQQVEMARENFRLVTSSKNAGFATYLELNDANTVLSNAETAVIAQNLNLNLAVLKLQHELGSFE